MTVAELKPGKSMSKWNTKTRRWQRPIETRWPGCVPTSISGYTWADTYEDLGNNFGYWSSNIDRPANPRIPAPPAGSMGPPVLIPRTSETRRSRNQIVVQDLRVRVCLGLADLVRLGSCEHLVALDDLDALAALRGAEAALVLVEAVPAVPRRERDRALLEQGDD